MILFQNGLVRLDYNPSTDILYLEWPSLRPFDNAEMRHSLQKLVEVIRYYDVKKLLIDVSNSRVDVDDPEYKQIVQEFVLNVMQTRLQKMACLQTTDSVREKIINDIKEETNPSFSFRNFSNQEVASEWLLQP